MSEQQPDVVAQLKRLRLYGMASAWADLTEQAGQPAGTAQQEGRWLVEHLLRAEVTDRAMRSVNYQMGRPGSLHTATWPASTSSRPRSSAG